MGMLMWSFTYGRKQLPLLIYHNIERGWRKRSVSGWMEKPLNLWCNWPHEIHLQAPQITGVNPHPPLKCLQMQYTSRSLPAHIQKAKDGNIPAVVFPSLWKVWNVTQIHCLFLKTTLFIVQLPMHALSPRNSSLPQEAKTVTISNNHILTYIIS